MTNKSSTFADFHRSFHCFFHHFKIIKHFTIFKTEKFGDQSNTIMS
jgi:hypothetical protein